MQPSQAWVQRHGSSSVNCFRTVWDHSWLQPCNALNRAKSSDWCQSVSPIGPVAWLSVVTTVREQDTKLIRPSLLPYIGRKVIVPSRRPESFCSHLTPPWRHYSQLLQRLIGVTRPRSRVAVVSTIGALALQYWAGLCLLLDLHLLHGQLQM